MKTLSKLVTAATLGFILGAQPCLLHAQEEWEGNLRWCEQDTGFNEGADRAVSIAVSAGLGGDPLIAKALGGLAGNIVPRTWVISAAKFLARTGQAPDAFALALTCQAHNAHAAATLASHPGEVIRWLATH